MSTNQDFPTGQQDTTPVPQASHELKKYHAQHWAQHISIWNKIKNAEIDYLGAKEHAKRHSHDDISENAAEVINQ